MLSLFIRVPFKLPAFGEPFLFQQKLDHSNPQDQTFFSQRYYKNSQYAEGEKPKQVVLYLGGEAELSERHITSGALVRLAQEQKAMIYGIEHRFYGESQPFKDMTTEHLKYLTVDQELGDIAAFIKFLHENEIDPEARIVVVGGSYTGSVSSWFRLKYPHLTVASWASSAPTHAKNEFVEYDQYVSDVLSKINPKCRDSTKSLFDQLNTLSDLPAWRELFQIPADKVPDEVSFLSIITDTIAGAVQYHDVGEYAKLLDGYCAADVTMESLAKLVVDGYKAFGSPPEEMDPLHYSEPVISDSRAWTWQTCNEFGWFQTSSGFRPQKIDLKYYERVCKALYDVSLADVDYTNYKFGGDDPSTTRVYFPNGGVDPWGTMGVHEAKPKLERYTVLIDGASHCSDMSPDYPDDTPALREARAAIIKQMGIWLSGQEPVPSSSAEPPVISSSAEPPVVSSTSEEPVTSSSAIQPGDECVHGRNVEGGCLCNDGYYGKTCAERVVSKTQYSAALGSSIAIGVVLLVVIVIVVVMMLKKRKPQYVTLDNTPLVSQT